MNSVKHDLKFYKLLVLGTVGVLCFHFSMVAVASSVVGTGMKTEMKLVLMKGRVFTIEELRTLPLLSATDFKFEGAFRIKASSSGGSKTAYSDAKIAYNEDSHSLFVSGHRLHGSIAEFPIPNLVKSDLLLNLPISEAPIQGFNKILERVDSVNINKVDRIGGLEYINGELLIHTYKYYDSLNNVFQTTLVARDANNLNSSTIDGFFEFEGRAHGILWVSPIPNEWQRYLGGDFLSGSSTAMPIANRSPNGPSALVFNSSDLIKSKTNNGDLVNQGVEPFVATKSLLDFSLEHTMANTESGWLPFSIWGGDTEYNYSGKRPSGRGNFPKVYDPSLVGNNDLWTNGSSAYYGIIIPGTRTYAVFGSSSMHKSGGGYKITQKNGHLCGGPCQYDPLGRSNYYWFFDVNDLLSVKLGKKKPYEVKPYDYGVFDTPLDTYVSIKGKTSKSFISGGTYDEKNRVIYFSLPGMDSAQSKYNSAPVIMAYKVAL